MNWTHLIAALGVSLLGAAQALRRKGDRPHRVVGAAYPALMLVVCVSSLRRQNDDGFIGSTSCRCSPPFRSSPGWSH